MRRTPEPSVANRLLEKRRTPRSAAYWDAHEETRRRQAYVTEARAWVLGAIAIGVPTLYALLDAWDSLMAG